MTIRRRLVVSYAVLLLLFACNLGVYLWTSTLRTRAMTALDRALQRSAIVISVRQNIDNLHKEVSLLSQMDFGADQTGNSPEAQAIFTQKLAAVSDQLDKLYALAGPSDRDLIATLREDFTSPKGVAVAWKGFYENLGVAQEYALAYVLRAEPKSREMQTELMPAIERQENQNLVAAQTSFARVDRLAQRSSIGFFVVSTILAFLVALLVSRHLSRGFAVLKHGTDLIGDMNLDHRIEWRSHDELGEFAHSFNSMADKLRSATAALTDANVELERRAQEIARRQQRELELAASIQQGLMQVRIPDLPFAHLAAKNISCTAIGGDFYDVVPTDAGLAVIICDVSGKGISAAIMASLIQGMIRADLAASMPLRSVAAHVNQFLSQREVAGKYATMVIVRLQADGKLEYVNCGHIPPVVVNRDGVARLRASNVPVGLLAGAEFQAGSYALDPGDRLVLVTDGVTEAENHEEEFFGDERLESAAAAGDVPFEGIFSALHQFCADKPFNDDCTIVEVQFTAAHAGAHLDRTRTAVAPV